MYRYETHLHTYPVSACSRASVRDSLTFYRQLGYDGVCVTNHFLDGNINIAREIPYEEKIAFFCSDYEEAVKVGEELGLRVFFGFECSHGGTDFLVYGLDKEWLLAHPECMECSKKEQLELFRASGALVIQAHPFRQQWFIDHIRLYPEQTEGVEVINTSRPEQENHMAEIYAREYQKLRSAGSDNHDGKNAKHLAGIETEEPLLSVSDMISALRTGKAQIFTLEPSLP